MELKETAAQAADLVTSRQAGVVRYAVAPLIGEPVHGIAQAAGGDADPLAPVDWMCSGKQVLAYAALRALAAEGLSCDDDLRPFVSATDRCPAITLREILTYRSGLVLGDRHGYTTCVTAPVMSRHTYWNPAINGEYSHAGWELLPELVCNLTGQDFGDYVVNHVLAERFGAPGAVVREGVAETYVDPAWIADGKIEKVLVSAELATSLSGSLDVLVRFYRGVAGELAGAADGPAAALVSANPGPDYFRRGISKWLTWALGAPLRLQDQGLDSIVPADGFGSIGSVLTVTPRGLRYAWVCAAGAIPSLGLAFAVAMDRLSGAPDPRYVRMAEALMRDVRAARSRMGDSARPS